MNGTFVPCEKCGAVNRVAGGADGKSPVCGTCKAELSNYHDGVVELSGPALNSLVKSSPIPVLVDFWAPWCGPCKSFAPVFKNVASSYAGRVVFGKLNTDDHQQVSQSLGIRGIPTLIAYSNGSEIGRQSGALPENFFRELVDEVLKRAGEAAADCSTDVIPAKAGI
ncbi:MAG: thioredoxin TrxC [Myxococcota bacterium]